jgi:hypothetical protein
MWILKVREKLSALPCVDLKTLFLARPEAQRKEAAQQNVVRLNAKADLVAALIVAAGM